MNDLTPAELMALSAIVGLLYGYIGYGTPILRRRALRDFLVTAGTAGLFYGIVRNSSESNPSLMRSIPWILFVVFVIFGARFRAFVDLKYTWRDLFIDDVDRMPDRRERESKK